MPATIKDEDIANLPTEKQELLRMAATYADGVKKINKPKGRSIWEFYFDEGAYQGSTVIPIPQNGVSARSVIDMLGSVGWPGFMRIVQEAETASLEVLRNRAAAKAA